MGKNRKSWLDQGDLGIRFGSKDDYALKAFTDNIVLGWPVLNDAEGELGRAFGTLAAFQLSMALEGFFVRGAIAVGDAYVDEIAVFGGAFMDAYKGEVTLARDPRIILTASAVDRVKQHVTYYADPQSSPQARDLLQDSDGQWFINYLDCLLIAEDEIGPCTPDLLKHKDVVEQKLRTHRSEPAVWAKYAWVAGYHNYFIDLHREHYGDEHKIELELFRACPSLIDVPPRKS